MRFMMMVKATKDYEAGLPPSPALMAEIGKLSGEMARAGVLLSTDGLQPSSQGMRVTSTAGRRTVTDGPFPETKELIGGYAIIEAASKKDALAHANRFIDAHVRAGVPDLEVEIRPLHDFAPCSAPSL